MVKTLIIFFQSRREEIYRSLNCESKSNNNNNNKRPRKNVSTAQQQCVRFYAYTEEDKYSPETRVSEEKC